MKLPCSCATANTYSIIQLCFDLYIAQMCRCYLFFSSLRVPFLTLNYWVHHSLRPFSLFRVNMIRQECRLKQLGLDYGSPRDFVVSRVSIYEVLYLYMKLRY